MIPDISSPGTSQLYQATFFNIGSAYGTKQTAMYSLPLYCSLPLSASCRFYGKNVFFAASFSGR